MNYSHKIVCILLAAVFFVPLLVSGNLFFPYITGKALVFRTLVELAAVVWICLLWCSPKFRPRASAWLWSLGAFLSVLGLSTLFSVDPFRSFWSNYERMEGLVTFLHLGAYALMLSSVYQTSRAWAAFWTTHLVASVLVVFAALGETFKLAEEGQGFVRLDATLGNPIYLAVYLLLSLGVAAIFFLRTRGGWSRMGLGVLSLGYVWALYGTATRSALLGLAGGLVIGTMIFVWRGAAYPRARRFALIAVVALVAVAGLFWLGKDSSFVRSNPVLARVAEISLQDATTRHRLMNWQMALEGFKERPILGWGLENYLVVFSKFYNPNLYDAEQWFDRTHNIFLDWLVSAGVLGLLSYLSLFVVALWYVWHSSILHNVAERSVITGLVVAYLIHNVFVFDNLTSYVIFFAGLAWLAGRDASSSPKNIDLTKLERIWRLGLALAIPLILVAGYFSVIVPWRGASALVKTLQTSDPVQKLSYFDRALAWGGPGRTEAREQLLQQSSSLLRAAVASSSLTARELIDQESRAEIFASPTNVRPVLFYGSYLRFHDRVVEALPYLLKAQELSPTKQNILFELVEAYGDLKQPDKALAVAREAYELAPKFRTAAEIYATWLGRTGQTAEARKILAALPVELSENLDLDEVNRQINSFIATERYDLAAALWQKVVDEHPQNAEYRFRLAAARLLNGEKNKSIEELQAAVKIEPRLSKQVEFLISEIRAGRNPISK